MIRRILSILAGASLLLCIALLCLRFLNVSLAYETGHGGGIGIDRDRSSFCLCTDYRTKSPDSFDRDCYFFPLTWAAVIAAIPPLIWYRAHRRRLGKLDQAVENSRTIP
jgi:hypothetical protein